MLTAFTPSKPQLTRYPSLTGLIEDRVGPAPSDPPAGFEYVMEMPSLETDGEQTSLVEKFVIHAWDSDNIRGWFVGR